MPAQNILGQITSEYDTMTKREKRVADYVLAHPEETLQMTISELAENAGVGDTTVYRFCRSLRLGGYYDFRMSLALSVRSRDMLDTKMDIDILDSGSCMEVARKIADVYAFAVRNAFDHLQYSGVDQAVNLLLSANVIQLFGFGESGIAASVMQHKFQKILPHINYALATHLQLTTAALMRAGDVAVVFSNSGLTKDCVSIARLAHEAGARVLFITMFLKTPAAPFADLLLPCGAQEGPFQGGSISALTAQLFMIDLLYAEVFRRQGETAEENKRKTAQAVSDKLL